jgi:16S rRNA processing protein RimM
MSASDSSAPPTEWTVLAHLLRPQGRRGEVLAELLTDFPERFADRKQIFLAPPHFAGNPPGSRPIQITGHWLPVGRNHGRVVLAFAGIDSIEGAEALAGLDVIIPAETRVLLEEDEEYIDDLVECKVYDLAGPDGAQLVGTVTGVDFPTTPDGSRRLEAAAPLLTVLAPNGQEILIPYVQSFLVSLSTADKRIDMNLPAGLLDLNQPNIADRSTDDVS